MNTRRKIYGIIVIVNTWEKRTLSRLCQSKWIKYVIREHPMGYEYKRGKKRSKMIIY